MNRKQLQQQSFKYFSYIMDNSKTSEEAIKLTDTPAGYKGTDNMTDEELLVHHDILKKNYEEMRK